MSEFKPITTQEDLDKIINARLARQKESIEKSIREDLEKDYADYEQIKSRNAELESAIEKHGDDIKNHETQVSDLQAQIAGFETSKLRTQVALQAGLPYDLAERLQGDDEAALKADAERLSGFMKPKAPAAPLKSTEPNLGDGKDAGYRKLAENLANKGE